MRNHLPPPTGDTGKGRAALLDLAFDADDQTKRITRGRNFLLAGGSAESHGRMQEAAVKINEHLDRNGTRLEEASIEELREICRRVHET